MNYEFEKIKKELLQFLKVLTIVLSLGVGVGMSTAWTGPACDPPNCNDAGPITVSNVSEAKTGGLRIGNSNPTSAVKLSVERPSGAVVPSDEICGDGIDNGAQNGIDENCPLLAEADSLKVTGGATFLGDLSVGKPQTSFTSGNLTVTVPAYPANLYVQPFPGPSSDVTISNLAHTATGTEPQPVCASPEGVLYLCSTGIIIDTGGGNGGGNNNGG